MHLEVDEAAVCALAALASVVEIAAWCNDNEC